jgi:L-lactate dehydrogenase
MKITFTIPGLPEKFTFAGSASSISPQEKKQFRLSICSQLPPHLVPFHACLFHKNGLGIVICGPSGSGKSTLADQLSAVGYQIMANDFLVVYAKKGQIFAGDLNFSHSNQGKQPIPVTNFIFLSPSDPRDCFRFNQTLASRCYNQTLAPLKSEFLKKFTNSTVFGQILNMHMVLGNRKNPQRWCSSIYEMDSVPSLSSVGIIGLGIIGQDLANLLLGQPWLNQLHLYSPNTAKLNAVVLDLKSAKPHMEINAYAEAISIMQKSDIVVICLRVKDSPAHANVEERMHRLSAHAEAFWHLSRSLRTSQFRGRLLVVTNPVDLMSAFLYQATQINSTHQFSWDGLLSHQIYGIGLGLDYSRLLTIDSGTKNIEVVGPHGDDLQLAKIHGQHLVSHSNSDILNLVKQYSNRVRMGVERTRFGPVHEVVNVINALRDSGSARISLLNQFGSFLGEPVSMTNQLPQPLYAPSGKLRSQLHQISKSQIDLTKRLLESKISQIQTL